jgi:hypothetical protein
VNLLDLTPVAAAEIEEQDGRVVVIRPKPSSRGLRAPLDWLVYLMAARRLRLDELGSFCWRQMDGRRTAGAIAEAMRTEFGESSAQAEQRLGSFLRSLRREDLVRFPELESTVREGRR